MVETYWVDSTPLVYLRVKVLSLQLVVTLQTSRIQFSLLASDRSISFCQPLFLLAALVSSFKFTLTLKNISTSVQAWNTLPKCMLHFSGAVLLLFVCLFHENSLTKHSILCRLDVGKWSNDD